MKEKIQFMSNDKKTKLKGTIWKPDQQEPIGVIQIAHGMVEYIDRYQEFAEFFTNKGYVVVGMDHLGHGDSVNKIEDWGYFADENGYNILIEDIYNLYLCMKKTYPKQAYFLMGHSMGSFLVRRCLTMYQWDIAGCIIVGTGYQPYSVALFGYVLASIVGHFKGERYRSPLVDNLAFGSYNKKFEPAPSKKEWLTKDKDILAAYLKDPKCNFVFSISAYQDLFRTLIHISKPVNVKKMDKNLPILCVSGEDDPVGNFGKGVKKVCSTWTKIGMTCITMKLYKDDRHELLNEVDRGEVFEDIFQWIKKRIKKHEFTD